MSQQDYFIQFASELGKLNGNIEAVLARLEKGDEIDATDAAQFFDGLSPATGFPMPADTMKAK